MVLDKLVPAVAAMVDDFVVESESWSDSQLSLGSGLMFPSGWNSGKRNGRVRMEILAGKLNLPVVCYQS